MKHLTLLALLMLSASIMAQDIHPLENVKAHYKSLQEIDAATNASRADLDEISYPMESGASGQQFVGIPPSYLSGKNVKALKELVKFPANSSDQTRAELDHLIEWQNKRTTSQRKRAMEIARIGYWPPLTKGGMDQDGMEDLLWEYTSVMKSKLNTNEYPATTRLLAGVTRDARIMEFTIKYHLKRPRPYHLESRLEPMGRVSNPSFASGHTLWAYIQAFTWSELIPAKRDEFLALAFEVGESREIMGIHYPSDEEAARIIAHEMLSLMSKNEQFKKDLESARNEWK